jgi:hypothetical protein
MKLARATEQDLKIAEKFMWMMNDVFEYGWMPRDINGNWDKCEKDYFEDDLECDLKLLYDRIKQCFNNAPGFLTRIILGYLSIENNGWIDKTDGALAINLEKAKEELTKGEK